MLHKEMKDSTICVYYIILNSNSRTKNQWGQGFKTAIKLEICLAVPL